jgi:dTDP-4-amino-4,6-dideoxygalactose transaminase
MKYLEGIWSRNHLTNHGPLVNELEEKLKDYLGVKHFFFVNNGTIAIQVAIKALELKGEIITTPFSYVATTSSIVWEGAEPIFVDIDASDCNIDPNKIEAAITRDTAAILATHVYGNPCNVEKIEDIAQRKNIKVIYDAAHAFGVKYKSNALVSYGDISTLSFHATKLFHTVEGGGIITNDDTLAHRISFLRNFGHKGQEDFWGLGINGKASEFHAAMGLCVFSHLNEILERRKKLLDLYDHYLKELSLPIFRPLPIEGTEYNNAYYPIIFKEETHLLAVKDSLNAVYIYPRRYFYPSLNQLPYINKHFDVPIAESISKRVLCLPLYPDLGEEVVKRICQIIYNVLKF